MTLSVFGSNGPATLGSFTPTETSDDRPRFRVTDHTDKVIILTVAGMDSRLVEGEDKPCLSVPTLHVVEADGTVQTFTEVLLFNGPLIDQLSPQTGQTFPVVFYMKKGKSGRSYAYPRGCNEAETALAEKAFASLS